MNIKYALGNTKRKRKNTLKRKNRESEPYMVSDAKQIY